MKRAKTARAMIDVYKRQDVRSGGKDVAEGYTENDGL